MGFKTILVPIEQHDLVNSMPIPAEAARHSGMMPPTDSEMISPTVPR